MEIFSLLTCSLALFLSRICGCLKTNKQNKMAADGWLSPAHRQKHLHARFARLNTCHSWSACRAGHTPLLINLHMPIMWCGVGWEGMHRLGGRLGTGRKSLLGFFSVPLLSSLSLLGESEGTVRAPLLPAPHHLIHSTPLGNVWCRLHLPLRRANRIQTWELTTDRRLVPVCGRCKFCQQAGEKLATVHSC